jgi:uncharacterized protein (TIGR02145 family)
MRALVAVLSISFGTLGAAASQQASGAMSTFKRMPDGKEWTTTNLNVGSDGSCYDDSEANCRRYGRLYSWDSAQKGCHSLGDRWRLPTDEEWRQLATHHGGLMEESADRGKAAYTALITGGSSGFNAQLGGGRVSGKEPYARLEAHGLYWSASESSATTVWFYNFGKGGQAVNRHRDGNKQMALSVRCVRN